MIKFKKGKHTLEARDLVQARALKKKLEFATKEDEAKFKELAAKERPKQ